MQLYAVTDRRWAEGEDKFLNDVELALEGGITCLQLREKHLDDTAFIALASKVKALCSRYDVPFIINDNVAVALAVDADGIHVGQGDMPARDIRKTLGDKIIGVSVHSAEEARKAKVEGADYLGVGAAFATSTKDDANVLSKAQISAVCDATNLPIVAIGGITKDNASALADTGVNGIAVVSAIFGVENISEATSHLLQITRTF